MITYESKYFSGITLNEEGQKIIQERWNGNFAEIPHCDQSILHVPGTCEFCDHFPDWQIARIVAGICFTGETPEERLAEYLTYHNLSENSFPWKYLPDPATFRRPQETIEEWAGNVHENVDTKEARDKYWNEVEDLLKE